MWSFKFMCICSEMGYPRRVQAGPSRVYPNFPLFSRGEWVSMRWNGVPCWLHLGFRSQNSSTALASAWNSCPESNDSHHLGKNMEESIGFGSLLKFKTTTSHKPAEAPSTGSLHLQLSSSVEWCQKEKAKVSRGCPVPWSCSPCKSPNRHCVVNPACYLPRRSVLWSCDPGKTSRYHHTSWSSSSQCYPVGKKKTNVCHILQISCHMRAGSNKYLVLSWDRSISVPWIISLYLLQDPGATWLSVSYSQAWLEITRNIWSELTIRSQIHLFSMTSQFWIVKT